MSSGSPWRTLLSIVLLLFAVVRLVMTCTNDKSNASKPINQEIIDQSEAIRTNNVIAAAKFQQQSNDILYTSYKDLEDLSETEKQFNHLKKLEKDTIVQIDLSTRIKIQKESYFQNNHDDTLRMAFKLKKDLTIFLHDFESKKEDSDNFKALKSNGQLSDLKLLKSNKNSKTYSYSIVKKTKKYNGFVLLYKSNELCSFIEFESDVLTKPALESAAYLFIINNVIN
jgi:hypothetical protein